MKKYRKIAADSTDIDSDSLKELLLSIVDEIERRSNHNEQRPFDDDVIKLVSICSNLWSDREEWKQKYYDMAERYNEHLDADMAMYNEILRKMGKHSHG